MAAKKTYSELQSQLDDVLSEMQNAELDIDKAISLHKQGEKLIAELENHLKEVENKIHTIRETK